MAVRVRADRARSARGANTRRLIARLAAAGLVVGALGQSVAPGLGQDTTSTSSAASDPAPTAPASTLGTTTPTTGTTQTATAETPLDPGTYTVDPGPTTTVTVPPPKPKPKPKTTNPPKPGTRCVTPATRTRLAIRAAKENAVGQPRRPATALPPLCKTTTHPKRKATPRKVKTNSNGTPSPSNPTFSLAQPGPAQIGVPNFFIEKFRIPPFLLPIYQAAGTEYGIPWQVLAAINEIETDYGRNLSVSSAGALGWMQFMPASWATYGVDANGDGKKDPFNPVDAIFAAGRYLRAAGGDKDINQAIFAYNHADWYVQSVLLRAKLIGGMPADLVGSLTGLTEGHFPVAARATYAQSLDPRAASTPRTGNAAVNVGGDARRHSIDIFSSAGAPAVAVNDGVIRKVGHSKALGNYVVLEDVYGNTYTYAHLGRVAGSYPAPKPVQPTASKLRTELEAPPRDPAPGSAASAGRQQRGTPAPRRATTSAAPVTAAPAKERLFAHPSRSNAYSGGRRPAAARHGHPGGRLRDLRRIHLQGARAAPLGGRLQGAQARGAGAGRHDPRPARPHGQASGAARHVLHQARRPRRTPDRPQAHPRRLEAARGHGHLPRLGQEPVLGPRRQEPLDRPDPPALQVPARAARPGRSADLDLRLRAAATSGHTSSTAARSRCSSSSPRPA